MNELIKVTENDGKQAVSAKELYLFLGYDKSHWVRWYQKNIINNEFAIKDEDYQGFALEASSNNGVASVDFILTIDFAKRLSMMAKTEKGEQARRYFIECENKLKNRHVELPKSPIELLRFAADEIEKRDKEIARLKPMEEFVEKVFDSEGLRSIGETAKILNLYKIGRNKFFNLLRDKGILFGDNEPKQIYVNKGYFVLKEVLITMCRQTVAKTQVFVTQRGIDFLRKVLLTEEEYLLLDGSDLNIDGFIN